MVAGTLQAIDTCGKVKASAPLAASSVQVCSPGGMKANLEPPVSATRDRIYYRDGDTKVRSLTPGGQTADATTVPGSATMVSFFSVSPDDQRIAVLVEDVSPANTIGLRLYVEDVQGGGHHADIYATSIPKSGYTLWPMGWHSGQLVLAVIAACTDTPGGVSPSEWHVVDPANANRKATITNLCLDGQSGILSRWPSPAGVVCSEFSWHSSFFDWGGANFNGIVAGSENSNDVQSGLSPNGKSFFYGSGVVGECGSPPSTCMVPSAPSGMGYMVVASGAIACFWIDDTHLMTPDAVLELPHLPLDVSPGQALTTSLPASGQCAGRFPGGL
jgi:hypothetical protein